MKNLSLILNVVLFIALGILYYLHFESNAAIEETVEENSNDLVSLTNLKVAYVNSDSLISNYEFYKDKAEELRKHREQSESSLESRAKGIESQVNDFQRTRGNMTMNQARAIEEDLYNKQQNLLQYRETLAQNLMTKESEVNNELYDNISQFLKKYGDNNNLEIVLSFSRGSGVLYANDSLDITQVVISGLNDAYRNKNANNADSTKIE